MGNVDKLLDALAQRLPRSADRKALSAALRAAAEELPAGQVKTRARLLKNEASCIRKLEQRLRENHPSEDEASPVEEAEVPDEQTRADVAGYASVSRENPHACIGRCSELLRSALTSARPAHHAQKAIDGLLALLPPEELLDESGVGQHFDLAAVQSCVQLVPTAVALLRYSTASETLVWHRFLGFLLVVPLRLLGDKESKTAAVIEQLGNLVTLIASADAARSALRLTLSAIASATDSTALTRFAPAIFLVANIGFGRGALDDADLVRGDLVALLHLTRLVGLCSSANAATTSTLDEVRDLLRLALGRHFDAALMIPECQRLLDRHAGEMPRAKVLRKRLASVADAGRQPAASIIVDIVEALAPVASPVSISRLAEPCGLPIGKDERVDQRAAVARAQGDIFFEDIEGQGEDIGFGATGSRAKKVDAVAAAAAHVHSKGHIEGVEALAKKSKGAEDTPNRKRALSKRPLLQVAEDKEQDGATAKSPKRPAATAETKKSKKGHGTSAESTPAVSSPKTKRQRKQ